MCGIGLKLWITVCYFGINDVVTSRCLKIAPTGDVFVRVGEDVQVNCTLKTVNESTENFTIYNISIDKTGKRINPERLSYFEEYKTVVLALRNASFEDSGYYCCFYNGECESKCTNLRIGEVPRKPKDVFCISDNFNDLRCTFQLDERKTKIPTNTVMKFKMNQNEWMEFPESTHCTNMMKSVGTCWLDSSTAKPSNYVFMNSAKYAIRVVTLNKLGKNSSRVDIKNTGDIVKPAKIEIINVEKMGSGVSLRWKSPERLIYKGSTLFPMDYNITITSEWRDKSLFNIQNLNTAFSETIIKDLKPFTNYTFTVQAKPTAADRDIYWSDMSNMVSFLTDSIVSTNTINTTIGCYMWLDDTQIVLFWKNPSRRYWCGNITGYKITIERFVTSEHLIGQTQNNHFHEADLQSENLIGLQTSAALETKLRQTENYKAKVFIKNSEGVANSYSEVAITNWNTGILLRPGWVSVEVAESSLDISWNTSANNCKSIIAVTYYWCKVDNTRQFKRSFVSCMDSIEWRTFKISDGCGHKHRITSTSDNDNIKFAVSLHTNGRLSGGMVWESLRFSKYEVPEKPLYSMSVDGSRLKVQVLYAEYHVSKGGLPDNYSVQYTKCKQEDSCTFGNYFTLLGNKNAATSRIFPTDFLNPIYIIDNLTPGIQYSVRVSCMNGNGSSIYGETVKIKIVKDVKFENVAEVAWAVSIVIVCSLGGCLAFFLRNKYKLLQNRFTITTPKEQENTEEADGPCEHTSLQGDKENKSCDENFNFGNSDNIETFLTKNEDECESENTSSVVINEQFGHDLNIEATNDSFTKNVHKPSSDSLFSMPVEENIALIPELGGQGYLENDINLMTNNNSTEFEPTNSYVTANYSTNKESPMKESEADDYLSHNFVPTLTHQISHGNALTTINEIEVLAADIRYMTVSYSSNDRVPIQESEVEDYVLHVCVPTPADQMSSVKPPACSDYVTETLFIEY